MLAGRSAGTTGHGCIAQDGTFCKFNEQLRHSGCHEFYSCHHRCTLVMRVLVTFAFVSSVKLSVTSDNHASNASNTVDAPSANVFMMNTIDLRHSPGALTHVETMDVTVREMWENTCR